MAKLLPAIFLDRDGTINFDNGYTCKINEFQFIDGVIDSMRKLKKMGYLLVVVTNQSGIARGKFTKSQFRILTKQMNQLLLSQGVDLDGIYCCPHLPQGNIQEYSQICNCRKPNSGMLKLSKKYFHIDMNASFMVGDTLGDMQAGKEAKVGKKVLVLTGKTITEAAKKSSDWIIYSLADLPKEIEKSRVI